VQLALHELGGAAARRNRFADAPGAGPRLRALGGEAVPGVEDAAGIAADDPHVSELHGAGLVTQRRLQQPDLAGIDHGQDGFAGGESLPDERRRGGHELSLAGVQERLVPEGRVPTIPRRRFGR
jgi:hypothetical protein